MFTITILSDSFDASSLNLLTCASQTGVSNEGVVENNFILPIKLFNVNSLSVLSTTLKSGALSPIFNSGPTSVNGLPFIVTAFFLSINHLLFFMCSIITFIYYIYRFNINHFNELKLSLLKLSRINLYSICQCHNLLHRSSSVSVHH